MRADAQWMKLEPLIEACRPKGKTPPKDLRRTISAIVRRHQNGAKWFAIPAELAPWSRGPWSRAAQTFIRWALWERLLALVQERRVQLGIMFSTGAEVSRSCAKRGSQSEQNAREALGRSRGGSGTKACVIADGLGSA